MGDRLSFGVVRHTNVLFVFGTRPEAIKLCPVLLHMRQRTDEFSVKACVTAQHRGMLDQVLAAFHVTPDYDLDVMQPGQTLAQSTARILSQLEPILAAERPGMVVVQGDTTTTLVRRPGGVLPADSRGTRRSRIAHRRPDAALSRRDEPRGDHAPRQPCTSPPPRSPPAAWPPKESPRERIFVTGNSGIDAVLYVRDMLASGAMPAPPWPQLDPSKKLIVVTAHRRESFRRWLRAASAPHCVRLARRGDVQIAYPVHRNPNVLEPVHRLLAGQPNILLLDPLDYVPFVDLMRRATLILTDSGGIQEEGPSLGKPILVMREKTERPEAVEAGTVKLVGTDEEKIVSQASLLLDDEEERQRMSRVHNPYGDGQASRRIADAIAGFRNEASR